MPPKPSRSRRKKARNPATLTPPPQFSEGRAGFGIAVFTLCFLASCLVVYQTIGPPATPAAPGASWSWLASFRALVVGDQLGYAAIAANVKWLNFDFVEPFTATGNIIYTRNWYVAIGLVAWFFNIPVTLSWQVCGIAGFLLGLGLMATACYRNTSRYWTSLIPGMLAVTGVYLGIGSDAWYQPVPGTPHAVFWSPYVLFHALNAEVGACFLLMVAAFLFFQSLFAPAKRDKVILLCASAFIVGFVSSVASYFFLAATLISLATIAFFEFHRIKNKTHRLLAWLIPAALFTGWILLRPDSPGGLAYYAIGVLPIAYLLLSFAVKNFYPAMLAGASFVAGILPQLLPTLKAILANDAFLAYRETSSQGNLNVPFVDGVIAAAPFLILIAVIVCHTLATNTPNKNLKRSLALGCLYGFFMLSWNNVWGFQQEPYRLWLNTLTLSALILSPLFAEALVGAFKVLRRVNLHRFHRFGTASLLALFMALYVNALPGFTVFANSVQFINVDTPDLRRQLSLINSTDYAGSGALLLLDPGCRRISPLILKTAAEVNVAYYRLGMAWPDNKALLDKLKHQLETGAELQAGDLTAANIFGVLTHSQCPPPTFQADAAEIVREPDSGVGADDYYALYRVVE